MFHPVNCAVRRQQQERCRVSSGYLGVSSIITTRTLHQIHCLHLPLSGARAPHHPATQKKRQGIRTNAQVVKSSGQICRHWGTVHIFFLSSESGGQYLLSEKHRGSTMHFKATAANGEGIFVSALAKKQTPETWHFTWITGFLQYNAGDEKNSRIVSPKTTVLLNSFFHQKTLDY